MIQEAITNTLIGLSSSERSRRMADNWTLAQNALCAIADSGYRETPVAQYPLQLLCLVVSGKDGFHEHTSADKERLVEKMKAALVPVAALLGSQTALALPTYSLASALIPPDGERCFFADQLKEDFKRLNQQAADALATALYAVVYACYGDAEDGVIKQCLRFYVDDPYEIGQFARMTDAEQIDTLNQVTKTVVGAPQATAPTAAAAVGSPYRVKKAPGKWLPLKVYLMVTTLFVALVFGLVFWSLYSGVGASSMSIMDTSGEMVAIEPDMPPATLFLFGTVDYDSLMGGIRTAVLVFLLWRVVLTTAVYLLNARRRRRYHP